MAKGFRPNLVPPSHRQVETEGRRSCLCVGLSLAVTFLVFIVFGVSGWNLYKHRFSLNTVDYVQEAAVNDISDDFSSTFCHSYKVSSKTNGILYLLPEHARVNTSYKDILSFTKFDVFRKLFLLRGSEVYFTACRKDNANNHVDNYDMVYVKGFDDVRNYRRGHHCHSCKSVQVPICQNGHVHEPKASLNYTAPSNDFYYLIFSFHPDNKMLDFNGTLARTHFDIRNAHKKCNINHNTSCQFDLPWQSDEDIVFKFSQLLDDGSNISTECQIRLEFWLCIFVVLPVIIVLPITLLLTCFLCKIRKRNFSAVQHQAQLKRRKAQDKRTLVHSEVIPDDTDGTTIQTDDS